MANTYRVWLERFDYRSRMVLNGDILAWPEIQRLLGEKLLECQSAKMHSDGTGYTLYGQYAAAGGQLESFTYELTFERV